MDLGEREIVPMPLHFSTEMVWTCEGVDSCKADKMTPTSLKDEHLRLLFLCVAIVLYCAYICIAAYTRKHSSPITNMYSKTPIFDCQV